MKGFFQNLVDFMFTSIVFPLAVVSLVCIGHFNCTGAQLDRNKEKSPIS